MRASLPTTLAIRVPLSAPGAPVTHGPGTTRTQRRAAAFRTPPTTARRQARRITNGRAHLWPPRTKSGATSKGHVRYAAGASGMAKWSLRTGATMRLREAKTGSPARSASGKIHAQAHGKLPRARRAHKRQHGRTSKRDRRHHWRSSERVHGTLEWSWVGPRGYQGRPV